MKSASLTLTLALLGASVAVVGCDKPAAPTAPQVASAAVAAAPFSINELMVMIVDHPGELLWDVEKDGHKPKTDEQWYQLENHAVELASAATVIKLGGHGPKDMEWSKDAVWQSTAQALTDSAVAARLAAHNKDLAGLIKANGEIVDACEACHKTFKPDIPTGGLFMHHPPAKTKA